MARRVKVDLVGDARSMNHAFKSAGVQANKFGREASRTRRIAGAAFKGLGIAGAIGGALVVKGLVSSVKAAMESQKVQAQTAAALKSTGSVANVTAKRIANLANSISQKTGIDDEAIQSTENLLLTFTKIRNEVGKGNNIFDQATVAVQDMSVALGQDGKSSAIQLGKALGDPVKGMTALRRVGVTFSQDQVDLVKKLVATGHTLTAQKLILREVKKEFGGSATAAGKTFGGQMARLRVNVENLQERIGTLLLPVLTRWAAKINDWLAKAKNQRKVIHDIRVAVRIMVTAFRIAARTINAFIDVGKGLVGWYRTLVRVNNRLEASFRKMWVGAKKHVLEFYVWMKRMGIKIALAIIEPFPHLPGFLGGGKFQKIKAGLEQELASMDPKAQAAAKRKGVITSPVGGAIPGAGGRLGIPAPPGPRHGRREQPPRHETVVHTHVHLDGKQVAKSTTKHQHRARRKNAPQRTGRHPGAN